MAIELRKDALCDIFPKGKIAEMKDPILRTYGVIPQVNHPIIHLINRLKGPIAMGDYVFVTKVSVCNEESFHLKALKGGGLGRIRTYSVSNVPDLQSGATPPS